MRRGQQAPAIELGNSPDDTVGTLSDLLGHGVAFVDNKVLVKDLEDLASLEIAHGGDFGCTARSAREKRECGAAACPRCGSNGNGGAWASRKLSGAIPTGRADFENERYLAQTRSDQTLERAREMEIDGMVTASYIWS